MSLRRRVLVGVLAVAVVLVGVNVLLARMFRSFLVDRVDRQLVDVASRPFFRPGRFGPPGVDRAVSEYFIAVGDPRDTGLTRVVSELADADDPPPVLDRRTVTGHLAPWGTPPRPFTAPAESGGASWRLVALGRPDERVVIVGLSLAEVDSTMDRIRWVQVAGTAGVLAALGLVSWWMLRLGVHPIEDMARTADAIAAGDLSRRIEHPGPGTEAGRLGTALNAMLERIEEAFRAREASEARLRQFAADASHELRTPLTSIRGYAELFRAGALRSDDELAEAMRRIEEEATRMGALVEDLLVLARLDQRRPLERAPVRLDLVVADGVRDAKAVEPDRPVDVSLEEVTVAGDEARLRQVVANLLANARQHTPPGTPVHVSVTAADGVARLVVADEGPGMPPEVAARVFERFFRADPSRSRAAGGAGLGLAIVAAVAEAHGGRAGVESAPGAGSRFTVELPLAATP
jgi:two-component system OmpR family sensor kinase